MPAPQIDTITADVLHSAVHDLKGPANRLCVLAELLGRNAAALDDDARKLLGHVEDSAAAVRSVADGLRGYAEICTRALHREPLNLNLVLASAQTNLRAELVAAQAEITSSALPNVQADRFLMTWLFQELLTNAVRFRAACAPRVHVSSGTGGPGGWFVSVADRGPGIESALAERAFRPFKKLSGGDGAGLGLTICRKIVELHDGSIWIEPRDAGADIRFFVSRS